MAIEDATAVYKNREGVSFWAEPVGIGTVPAYHVVSQADGYPATESYDDWFANLCDADQCAKDLSEGMEV